jgi:NAD(P)-dependent dehydrogenase (short-subunit alcohol dehydrogenase family)
LETVSAQDLRRQFETNVFGLTRMCQLVLPGMRAQKTGRIVNISSMGANFTLPGAGAYHATKYAVEALSDALRFEVKGFGVKVVIVQPGLIRTEFGATAAAEVDTGDGPYAEFNAAVAQLSRDAYEKGPLARLGGGPEAVAKTIEIAITTSKPKIRYRVTPSAHLLITQRKLMSDGIWDRFLATQFTSPSA